MQGTKRVYVGYARVSTIDQSLSLDTQRHVITEYINRLHPDKDFELKIFSDDGMTGRNMDRPALHEVLELAKSGGIFAVVSTEISRLSRSIVDLNRIVKTLRAYNIGVIIIKECIDTIKDPNMLILNIMGAIAQNESDKISERVKMGVLSRKKRGLYVGKKTFGYARDNHGMLKIIEEEATIVNIIFDKYIETGSYTAVTRWLNENGYKNANRTWEHHAVYRLLNNPYYIAKIELEGRLIDAQWAPIIAMDKWEQVQHIFSANRRTNGNSVIVKKHCYLFAGILYCPVCQCRLKPAAGTGKLKVQYYYYKHTVKTPTCTLPKYISADIIDKELFKEIVKKISNEVDINMICNLTLADCNKSLQQCKSKITTLKKQIAAIDTTSSAIVKKMTLFDEIQIIEIIKPQLEHILAEKLRLQKILQEEEYELYKIEKKAITKEMIIRLLQDIEKIYYDLDSQKKRSLIRLIIDKIEIYDDTAKCFICVRQADNLQACRAPKRTQIVINVNYACR